MPALTSTSPVQPIATAELHDATLHFRGRLDRDSVSALWRTLPKGTWTALDLSQVSALDTAGLALLVETAAHCGWRAGGGMLRILDAPPAYDALCLAYRIRPELEECPDAPLV